MTPVDLPPPPQHFIDQTVRIVQRVASNSGTVRWDNEPPRVLRVSMANAAACWVRDAFSQISNLTALRPDWDTYGAPAIRASAIAAVASFIIDHAYGDLSAPAVVPMSDGGVQLEWHRGGVDIEIAFSEEEPGVYVEDLMTGEVIEGPLSEAALLLTNYRERLAT